MKRFAITQFSILAVISGVVAWLIFLTGGLTAHHWNEFFYGGNITRPAVTVFAMHYGYLVPLICCLSSIVCVVISMKRPSDLSYLWRLFTLIVIVELIGLSLIAWLNMFPALNIMYRFMSFVANYFSLLPSNPNSFSQ